MNLFKSGTTTCLAAVFAVVVSGPIASAQQENQDRDRPEGNRASNVDLFFPTGEQSSSLLMIRAQAPAEVRVGQGFEYELSVRNLTDNLTLEDVRILHDQTGDVTLEAAEVEAAAEDGEHAEHGDRPRAEGRGVAIGELKPGQAETVKIRAVGEAEGSAGVCFRVSYTPTICLVTRFVKPDIELTKAVPEVADICQPLRFKYTVTNSGSADVRGVIVADDLPEGLTLANGEETLRHEVGDLPAGESREFTADVRALRLGQFASRAIAQGADEVRAQSQRPSTRIVAAELSATIEGPDVQYTNQPSTYRVTVRNDGDGPAIDTTLDLDADERTRLVRTSKTSRGKVAPEQDGNSLSWDIGRLDPGEETVVSFSVNLSQVPQGYRDRERGADESGEAEALTLRHLAVASSRCAADDQPEEVRTMAAAQAVAEAEILTLPALLLALVDRNDQVPQGENVEYVVTVANQGTGMDHDVQITMTLPEGLEYVSAEGPTDAQPEGQKIGFGAVDAVAPGEEVRWIVVARANTSGQVSTRVDLDSDFLSTTAVSIEPTTILGEGTRPSQPAPGDTEPGVRPGSN